MLILFPFFLQIISAQELRICFYKANETLCVPESHNFDVDNFNEYETAELPAADTIFFDFQSSLKDGDSINLTRFADHLTTAHFAGFENSSTPTISVTTDTFVPSNLTFENVETTLNFNQFTSLSIINSPLTVKDQAINATGLKADGVSISSITLISANKVSITDLFSATKAINIRMISHSENSTFAIGSFSTISLMTDIIFSRICFSYANKSPSALFDFDQWNGKLTISHSSLMEKEINMILRCLAYSKLHTVPFFRVNFIGNLNIPKSNWPVSTEPLFEVSGTTFPLLSIPNIIQVGDFIPANVNTGVSTLYIDPVEPYSGFLKVTVEHDNLSIYHPVFLLENYYFYINELETSLPKNTTVFCDPPLLYVSIDRFTHKSKSTGSLSLLGSGNYIIKSLPSAKDRSPTIYIEHLWLESNVTFPFDLESYSTNIQILDYVLMNTWPTYFIPIYTGSKPDKIPSSSHKIICAKLLKEEKESLLFPVNGYPNGFTRGTSVLHSYYQQDPDTEQQMKCFGYNIEPSSVEYSTVFCLATDETKSKCPQDSLYISATDSWDAHVQTDAGELTFHLLLNDASTFSFAGFSMVNVSIFGNTNQQVAISPENIDWLTLSHVTASFTSSNSLLNLNLTNVVLDNGDNYIMGPLYTDAASLKSLKCSESLQVPVTITDVTDKSISFNADGSVSLKESGVTFHVIDNVNHTNPSVLIMSDKVTEVTFGFEPTTDNSTYIVKFNHQVNAQFTNPQNSPANLIFDGFIGTLNLKQVKSVPFKFFNAHDIDIESDEDFQFDSDFEISGSLTSNRDITINSLLTSTQNPTSIETHLQATNLEINANSTVNFTSVGVTGTFSMNPGSTVFIENAPTFPSVVSIIYNLANLPFVQFGSKSNVAPELISFENVASSYNFIIKNQTNAFKDGIDVISGLDCSKTKYEFRSEYIYYQGEYSLLTAQCVDHTVRLFLNENAVPPPEPTPIPFIPTQSPTPDNTNKQVVIISCTVLAFFFIIVFVIIKCMNKKKKYVPKKPQAELNTVPLLEGNAE